MENDKIFNALVNEYGIDFVTSGGVHNHNIEQKKNEKFEQFKKLQQEREKERKVNQVLYKKDFPSDWMKRYRDDKNLTRTIF